MKKYYFTISIDGIAAAVKERQGGRLSGIITVVRRTIEDYCKEKECIVDYKLKNFCGVRYAELCFELPDDPMGWSWLAHDTACAIAARTMGATDPFWLQVYNAFEAAQTY